MDGDCDNAVWSFVQGQHFVVGEAFTEADMYHALVDLNQFAANTSIIVEANVNFGDNGHQTCRGEIDVPAIPCLEYV